MYACKAATKQRARCRYWAEGENGFCSPHERRREAGEMVETAPRPDTVLYKFNLNKTWTERLTRLGVPIKEQDFVAKEAMHVAHAEKHGRGAYVIRKNVADSGVPVFGEEGLVNVSLYEVLKELVDEYEIVDIHIQPRRDRNRQMNVLVVSFSHGENAVTNTEALQELLDFLSSSCWGYCHVWANPPQDDGKVVHTVNSSHRKENKQPERILRFDEGLWAEEEKAE